MAYGMTCRSNFGKSCVSILLITTQLWAGMPPVRPEASVASTCPSGPRTTEHRPGSGTDVYCKLQDTSGRGNFETCHRPESSE